MAKKPEETNRFRLSFETTEERVGEMMRVIIAHGCHVSACEIITDVHRYERNKPRAPKAAKAIPKLTHDKAQRQKKEVGELSYSMTLALRTINKHRKDLPASIRDIQKTLEAHQLSANSAGMLMTNLIKEGLVERVGVGLYVPKAINGKALKALPAPAKKEPKRSVPSEGKPGARELIVISLQKQPMSRIDLQALLERNGFAGSSINSALSELVHGGRIIKPNERGGAYAATAAE